MCPLDLGGSNLAGGVFRLALLPQYSQALHVFDRRFVPRLFWSDRLIYFGLSTLVPVKRKFGGFAAFCVHYIPCH